MPHRVTRTGRVQIADMYQQVMRSPSPDPNLAITPAEARRLAVELVERADAAEDGLAWDGFVTRTDLLLRVAVLHDQIEALAARTR